MPYVETATSRQDIGFDGDGYIHFTRTFQVWNVNPQTFHAHLSSIYQNGTTNVALPPYGAEEVIDTNPSVLAHFLSGADTSEGNFVKAPCILHNWTLSRISAVMFGATAHYSNDPHLTPQGAQYHATQQQAMVTIPYARSMPLSFNSGTGTSVGYVEAAYQLPMAVEHISHTVTIPRSVLKQVERATSVRVNELHDLPTVGLSAFIGFDVRMRGVQWLDITYNWQWQSGVRDLSSVAARFYGEDGADSTGTLLPPKLPGKVFPLLPALGTTQGSKMVLPQYHSIEMMWWLGTSAGPAAIPNWQYRCPYRVNALGWSALFGSSKFIWGGGSG